MMRKWMMLILLVNCLLLEGLAPIKAADVREIIIFHTNDQHGYMQDDSSRQIGIARIAGWKDRYPGSLLVDSGDAFYGSALANTTRGAAVVELMNAAGYDAMVPGNHDFTYGQQRLKELSTAAAFPILTSNVYEGSAPFLKDTFMKEVQGVKIGFFGLVSEETLTLEGPEKLANLTLKRPLDDASRCVELLKQQGADIIIGLSHLGMDEKDKVDMAADIAKALPDIDVLIDAHSHHVLHKGEMVNRTLIVQAGKHEHYLGMLTIRVDAEGQIIDMNDHLINYQEAKKIPEKASVKALLETSVAHQSSVTSQTIAYTSKPMNLEPRTFSSLGTMAAESFRQVSETDIAFYQEDRRYLLPVGRINQKIIEELFPLDQVMVRTEISGKELKQFLESGMYYQSGKVETSFQMSKMKLTYHSAFKKLSITKAELLSGAVDLTSDTRSLSVLIAQPLMKRSPFKNHTFEVIGSQQELFYEYLEQYPMLNETARVKLAEDKGHALPRLLIIASVFLLSILNVFVFYRRKHIP